MASRRKHRGRKPTPPFWAAWAISLFALGMSGGLYYLQFVAYTITLPRWLSVVIIVGLTDAAVLPWAMRRWTETRGESIRLSEWFVVYLIIWLLASVYILFVKIE